MSIEAGRETDAREWVIRMKPMYAPEYDFHEVYVTKDVARMKAAEFRALGLDCEVVCRAALAALEER